jgi:hypothetical protein
MKDTICTGKNNIIIGHSNICHFNNCIIIGTGITATADYSLLIGSSEIYTSKVMTNDEFSALQKLLNEISNSQ